MTRSLPLEVHSSEDCTLDQPQHTHRSSQQEYLQNASCGPWASVLGRSYR